MKMSATPPAYMCNTGPIIGPSTPTTQPLGHLYANSPMGISENNAHLKQSGLKHVNLDNKSGRLHTNVDHSSRIHPNVTDTTNQQTGHSQQRNADSVKQCAGCGVDIIDRFLLNALDKYWHTACLKCTCCHANLGEIGASCFTRNGMILCKNDYLRMFGNPGQCSGCRQSIPAQELVMKAQSHVYHVRCFSCVVCHCQLHRGDRYSLYQGSLLCEHDLPKVIKGTIQVSSIKTQHKCGV